MSLDWPKHWISDDEQLQELLERWRGVHPTVWEYMVSHGRLLIRLFRSEADGGRCCYIYCVSCQRVEFGRLCESDLQFSSVPEQRATTTGRLYTVTAGSGLRVECRGLFGIELDRVLWLPRPSEYAEA